MALHTLTTLAKGAGFALGVAVAALAFTGWPVARGTGVPGADVVFVSAPTGELAVSPTGAFAAATDLMPSDDPARARVGRFAVSNLTRKPLLVRLRALPDDRALDGLLYVRIDVGSQQLFSGRLGSLRRWTRDGIALPVSTRRTLTFRIWLPASVESGFQGQTESVPLELKAVPMPRLDG